MVNWMGKVRVKLTVGGGVPIDVAQLQLHFFRLFNLPFFLSSISGS